MATEEPTSVPPPAPQSDDEGESSGNDEGERHMLEDFTRVSESHLWKLMMSFYDRMGPQSWAEGIVPHFITSNAFIARSYAKVLAGFLRDCTREGSTCTLDPTQKLYVIELGTGSGKFSFLMVKAIEELAATFAFPAEQICYVMTDFTQSNFAYWQDHPALKQYVDDGRLDFAIFDATEDHEITLARSGTVLSPGATTNPVCVVANYLFDTLYHDVFQVDHGTLTEGLVSTGSKQPEEDPLDPEIIKHMANEFQYREIDDSYYGDEEGDGTHFERLLHWYRDAFGDSSASILVPIGALRALRRLTAFSGGKAIVISGDKGHNNPEHFRGLADPHIAVHGSFSVMVNYHAVGAYFTSRGGFALHNPQEEASLKVSCFVLDGSEGAADDASRPWTGEALNERDAERAANFPFLREAFEAYIESYGPNDFFVTQKCLKEDAPTPSLKSIVAVLKLGDWDPDVFYKFRDQILDQTPGASSKLRNDLCRGMPRVWQNYYLLDKEKDVAFEIGRFFYGIRQYDKALTFYAESARLIGDHHVTHHNIGLCYYSIGEKEKAIEAFEASTAMNASYEKAKAWKTRVQNELAAAAGEASAATEGSGEGSGEGETTATETETEGGNTDAATEASE